MAFDDHRTLATLGVLEYYLEFPMKYVHWLPESALLHLATSIPTDKPSSLPMPFTNQVAKEKKIRSDDSLVDSISLNTAMSEEDFFSEDSYEFEFEDDDNDTADDFQESADQADPNNEFVSVRVFS